MSTDNVENKDPESKRVESLSPSESELAPWMGNISAKEQLVLTCVHTLGVAQQKLADLTRPLSEEEKQKIRNGQKIERQTAEEAIAECILSFEERFNSYSGGKNGLRSKQLAEASKSWGGGPQIAPSERQKELSWVDRHLRRRKPEIVSTTGVGES